MAIGEPTQNALSAPCPPAPTSTSTPVVEPRTDGPIFHVAPASGWINDPNGPLLFNGTYHLFYQHLPGSAVWGFNLVWGHAVSKDLIHWEVMPHAIQPSPDTVDGDGCFSGCAAIDVDGTPALLYTGVRLRGSSAAGPLPPPEHDLGLPFIETQCVVYAERPHADWRLPYWRKSEVPILTLPPPIQKLAGWRDPYVVGPPKRHPEHGWTMLIGSGIKDQGGTVLEYRSMNLAAGWQFAGELCSGSFADGTGIVWECPLLVDLPRVTGSAAAQRQEQQEGGVRVGSGSRSHFFCISPDACTNPTLYYLGDYVDGCAPDTPGATTLPDGPAVPASPGVRQGKFMISDALGPFRLDLGDVLYAPNTLLDSDKGRVLLWGWLQESRKVAGTYTYAGCLSCARELWLDYSHGPSNPRLVQRPVPELLALRRTANSWCWPPAQPSSTTHKSVDKDEGDKQVSVFHLDANSTDSGELLVSPGQSVPVQGVQGIHIDLELQLELVWPSEAGELQDSDGVGTFAVQPQEPAAPPSPGIPGQPGRAGDQGVKARAPPPKGACSGLILRSWQAGVEGAAAILYGWATHVLEVVFEALDPETHEFSLAAPGCRRVGGQLQCPPAPGEPLKLRVMLDHSLVEVFTGGGEVLSTRVYRGTPAAGDGAGIELMSLGCTTRVASAACHEMDSCWVDKPAPLPTYLSAAEEASAVPQSLFSGVQSPWPSRTPSRAPSRALSRQPSSGMLFSGGGATLPEIPIRVGSLNMSGMELPWGHAAAAAAITSGLGSPMRSPTLSASRSLSTQLSTAHQAQPGTLGFSEELEVRTQQLTVSTLGEGMGHVTYVGIGSRCSIVSLPPSGSATPVPGSSPMIRSPMMEDWRLSGMRSSLPGSYLLDRGMSRPGSRRVSEANARVKLVQSDEDSDEEGQHTPGSRNDDDDDELPTLEEEEEEVASRLSSIRSVLSCMHQEQQPKRRVATVLGS